MIVGCDGPTVIVPDALYLGYGSADLATELSGTRGDAVPVSDFDPAAIPAGGDVVGFLADGVDVPALALERPRITALDEVVAYRSAIGSGGIVVYAVDSDVRRSEYDHLIAADDADTWYAIAVRSRDAVPAVVTRIIAAMETRSHETVIAILAGESSAQIALEYTRRGAETGGHVLIEALLDAHARRLGDLGVPLAGAIVMDLAGALADSGGERYVRSRFIRY